MTCSAYHVVIIASHYMHIISHVTLEGKLLKVSYHSFWSPFLSMLNSAIEAQDLFICTDCAGEVYYDGHP